VSEAGQAQVLIVRSPKPARFPAYTIESEAGEVLASVPITASGNSHKLALAMAAAPELLTVCQWLEAHCRVETGTKGAAHAEEGQRIRLALQAAIAKATGE
jgi:hypothetical protein